ncbi:hypothetical protein [Pelomonas sp. KK5]|uniref:hypothetical protein n=1 Tax=Pelomonas sp. KK5 TaxID=1855730 RepID=UPI001301D5E4|nr:hypothetical protein [Pelomonas sp. KK5]
MLFSVSITGRSCLYRSAAIVDGHKRSAMHEITRQPDRSLHMRLIDPIVAEQL